jgi:hypothetical protein
VHTELEAEYIVRARVAELEHDGVKIQRQREAAAHQAAQEVAAARPVYRELWASHIRRLLRQPAGHLAH